MEINSGKIDDILIDISGGNLESAFGLAIKLFEQGFPEKHQSIVALSSEYQYLNKKELAGTFTSDDKIYKNSLLRNFIKAIADTRNEVSLLEKEKKENLELINKISKYKEELTNVRNDYARLREKVEESILSEIEEEIEDYEYMYAGKKIYINHKVLIVRKKRTEKTANGWWLVIFPENRFRALLFFLHNLKSESNKEIAKKLEGELALFLAEWGENGWPGESIMKELDPYIMNGQVISDYPISSIKNEVFDSEDYLDVQNFLIIEIPFERV